MLKLVTFTTSPEELKPMIGAIRRLYFGRRVEGLSVIWGDAEWDLDVNPFIQRTYSEYSLTVRPECLDEDWIKDCIRRVILEERPDVVVVPNDGSHYRYALELAKERGARTLHWPDRVYHGGALADAVGLLDPEESAPEGTVAFRDWEALESWLHQGSHAKKGAGPDPFDERRLLDRLWAKIEASLPERPYHCPERGIHAPEASTHLHLFSLARCDDPERFVGKALESHPVCCFVEAVNRRRAEGDRTFRYGVYDSEFALLPAGYDLRELKDRFGPEIDSAATIVNPRSGSAADSEPALILLTFSKKPLRKPAWWERFQLPPGRKLNIVLADSMNMAGSLANHCLTINRYTPHSAVGLCTEEHPWIAYPQPECRLEHVSANPSRAVTEALENADGFIFFEDDDETSPSWPIDLRPYVHGKPVVHLYIGYRIHKKVAAMQRYGRTVLTPLPHINRMVPRARFYAGFPPASLYDVPMRPPKSADDGILRVLQTPSMPHRIMSRFVYHKDTEAFIAASRELKGRFPEVEFWQLGGLPHGQILRARQLCDITLNHLRGYISLSGDEALYFKRPLVHAFDQYSINRHKEYWGLETPFPWLTATPQTLASVFERLIGDPELRMRLGEEGHQFIQDYFAPRLGILPLIWHLSQAEAVNCEI